MLARAVSHPLDRRQDAAPIGAARRGRRAPEKSGSDDRIVGERLSGSQPPGFGQQRQPRPRARAARGPVDLAVGEDRDIALMRTVGSVAEVVVEDRAVHAAEPGIDRMPG